MSQNRASNAIKVNTVLGVLGIVISGLCSIAVFRLLDAQLFAQYSVALAATSLCALIMEVGGGSAFSRYLPEARQNNAGGTLFFQLRKRRILGMLPMIILATVVGPWYGASFTGSGFSNSVIIWWLIVVVSTLQLTAQLSYIGLQSLFEHRRALAVKVAFSFLRGIVVIAAAIVWGSLEAILYGLGICLCFEIYLYNQRLLSVVGHEQEPLPAGMLAAAHQFGAFTIFDKLLIGLTLPNFLLLCLAPSSSAEVVASLGLAIDFSARLISIASLPFSGVLQPILNEARDVETLKTRGTQVLQLMAFVYSLTVVLVLPFIPLMLFLLYGEASRNSWLFAQWIVFSSCIDCIGRTSTSYFLRRGLFWRVFRGDLLLIILLTTLVHGSTQSALGSVLIYSAVRIMFYSAWLFRWRHEFGERGMAGAIRSSTIASILGALIMWYIPGSKGFGPNVLSLTAAALGLVYLLGEWRYNGVGQGLVRRS